MDDLNKKKHASRKSDKTKECPICKKTVSSRGLNGHMSLVHNVRLQKTDPLVNNQAERGLNTSISLRDIENALTKVLKKIADPYSGLSEEEMLSTEKKLERDLQNAGLRKDQGEILRLENELKKVRRLLFGDKR